MDAGADHYTGVKFADWASAEAFRCWVGLSVDCEGSGKSGPEQHFLRGSCQLGALVAEVWWISGGIGVELGQGSHKKMMNHQKFEFPKIHKFQTVS